MIEILAGALVLVFVIFGLWFGVSDEEMEAKALQQAEQSILEDMNGTK